MMHGGRLAWPLVGPWLALGLALAGPWPGPGWPLAWPWLALGMSLGWPFAPMGLQLKTNLTFHPQAKIHPAKHC